MARRAITSAVTLLVLLGLLVVAAVWGWNALFSAVPGEDTTPADGTCTTEQLRAGDRIRSKQVRVSVFNAGTRSGLAGQTLEALTRRGFLEGETDNAPADVDVVRVQVWSTVENDPRARLVARQFGKKVPVRFADEDLGPGIDVIVGDKYRRLVKAPKALEISTAQEVCVPDETLSPDF